MKKENKINNAGKENKNQQINTNKSHTTMYLYLREFCFLFALAITSYAALLNTPQKIGKPPPASQFFPNNCKIDDFYKGGLNEAFSKVSKADLSLIMYYAPWDAESQAARQEFITVADYLHEQVYFGAINCWAPFTECKVNFPKIKYFPVLVAYPHGKGIQYRGPLQSEYIIKFLLAIIRPVHRITNQSQVFNLFTRHDAVVVGSFLFNGNLGGPGYYTYYSASLKMLEKDPLNEVAFAVTTDHETASTSANVTLLPNVRMYLWNETHDFPLDREYTEETLVKWVWSRIHQVVLWASYGNGVSPYMVGGPTLLVFTPRNPLVSVNPVYNLLKELALRYYSCNNSAHTGQIVNQILESNDNMAAEDDDVAAVDGCESHVMSGTTSNVAVILPNALVNRTTCDIVESFCSTDDMCRGRNRSRLVYNYKTSMLTGWEDDRSTNWLAKLERRDLCRRRRHSTSRRPRPGKSDVSDEVLDKLTGLSCTTDTHNRSLSVVAVDSTVHLQLAEALGVELTLLDNQTVVFIVDGHEESQYLLKKEFTKSNLIELMLSYLQGHNSLDRHMRSTSDSDTRTLTSNRYPIVPRQNCRHTDTQSCVVELDSTTYLPYVLNQTQDVLVLYYTPYCAMCRSISHLYLLLSRYFRHFDGLSFARIDGENNDLQWQYVVDVYPNLLIFPALSKSDSRVFNTDYKFTIRNLIHFTLANLRPEARIPAMISLCISFDKLQDENEARKCKSKIQKESYEMIAETLKLLRKLMLNKSDNNHRRKKLLLNRLGYFRLTHLQLGTVDRLRAGSTVVQNIFHSYQQLLNHQLR